MLRRTLVLSVFSRQTTIINKTDDRQLKTDDLLKFQNVQVSDTTGDAMKNKSSLKSSSPLIQLHFSNLAASCSFHFPKQHAT
jgi:hypothetical protein